jgi:hypothetical protein
MKIWISIALLLALTGCQGTLVSALAFSEEQQQEAYDLIREVDTDRESTRARCRDIVNRQVDSLVEAGDYEAALRLLDRHYPPLVTVSVIQGFREGQPPAILTDPWPCHPRIPTLNSETGLLEEP